MVGIGDAFIDRNHGLQPGKNGAFYHQPYAPLKRPTGQTRCLREVFVAVIHQWQPLGTGDKKGGQQRIQIVGPNGIDIGPKKRSQEPDLQRGVEAGAPLKRQLQPTGFKGNIQRFGLRHLSSNQNRGPPFSLQRSARLEHPLVVVQIIGNKDGDAFGHAMDQAFIES